MNEKHRGGEENPRTTPAAAIPQHESDTPVVQKSDIPIAIEHAESLDPAAVDSGLDRAPVQAENPHASAADAPSTVHPEENTAEPEEVDAALATKQTNEAVLAESRKHTRRSFLVGGVAAAGAYGFYHWLGVSPQNNDLPVLLDHTYNTNARISRAVLDQHALAPTYPLSRAETLRVNGVSGLKKALRPESYRLQLVGMKDAGRHPRFVPDVTAWEYAYDDEASHEDLGHDTKVDPAKLAVGANQNHNDDQEEDDLHTGRKPRGEEEAGESYSTLRPGTPGLLLGLNDFLPRLQRHELVTQFKCIEGWSQIVHWAGVRLADFLELFPPVLIDGKEPKYVYMETPDGDYYNGYDLALCRHPQALLVTEMMGAPLTQFHGAPLRVHMPTKYGYKQIKRIGLIAYTNEKPDDYWNELGYDWFGGL